MNYIEIPRPVQAVCWRKNGDHPDDDSDGDTREGKVVRYFRLPGSGDKVCPACQQTMHVHGWIDEIEAPPHDCVCPGDWVITLPNGEHAAIKPAVFEKHYVPYDARLKAHLEELLKIVMPSEGAELTCVDCGSTDKFKTITNKHPGYPDDYDIQCVSCKSVNVVDSPIAAVQQLLLKIDELETKLALSTATPEPDTL